MADEMSLSLERMTGTFHLTANDFIDFDRCLISMQETEYLLTAREVEVLVLLIKSPNRYHTTRELAKKISTNTTNYGVSEHSIQQTISVLRHKLGEDGKKPRFIFCRRGIGYGLFIDKNNGTGNT